MSKAKEQKQTRAELIAQSQKVGYLNGKEFKSFMDISAKIRSKPVLTVMQDIIMVKVVGVKFYADNE